MKHKSFFTANKCRTLWLASGMMDRLKPWLRQSDGWMEVAKETMKYLLEDQDKKIGNHVIVCYCCKHMCLSHLSVKMGGKGAYMMKTE